MLHDWRCRGRKEPEVAGPVYVADDNAAQANAAIAKLFMSGARVVSHRIPGRAAHKCAFP